jgi:ubiquinone biosynthesis protein
LKELQLTKLFNEIREHLAREVDLAAEQEALAHAASVYNSYDRVRVPKLAPFCTETLTAMEHIKGEKITEIAATAKQKTALARQTFETIICRPLFWPGDRALFHGDPHAGNIIAVPDKNSDGFEIALIDWTLAGFLSKKQRSHIMELMLGILSSNIRAIISAIKKLSVNSEEELFHTHSVLEEQIKTLLVSLPYQSYDHLKKTFKLLEEMTLSGVVFSSDLMLFRKAFFTLEGVLNDLSPNFALHKTMESYLSSLLIQEMPVRVINSFAPTMDKVENYRSLLTNQDLYYLYLQNCMTAWSQQSLQYNDWIEALGKLAIDFANMSNED